MQKGAAVIYERRSFAHCVWGRCVFFIMISVSYYFLDKKKNWRFLALFRCCGRLEELTEEKSETTSLNIVLMHKWSWNRLCILRIIPRVLWGESIPGTILFRENPYNNDIAR